MTDQEDNINRGKIVFDDNNQEKKSWACLGQTCSGKIVSDDNNQERKSWACLGQS